VIDSAEPTPAGDAPPSDVFEAVARMAGGIAHDFNNLLTAILGYADLLDNQLVLRGDMRAERSDLREIRLAAERGTELTQRLLSFAHRRHVSPRILDANRLLVAMERLLRRMVRDSVSLETVPYGEPAFVIADPSELEQVMLSLVVNAQDAMPSGGKMTLRIALRTIARDGLPAGIVIGNAAPGAGEFVEVAVTDSGAGMPPEFVRRAFEPYITTKPDANVAGTGLGLSAVFGLVTQAHGVIVVQSALGTGTTVSILLPRVTIEADDDVHEFDVPESGASGTILLAEDDEEVRTLNARILRSVGYVVHLAEDGAAAAELARTSGVRFDLVITDIMMPHLNGWEVAEVVRSEQPSARVLLVSGLAPESLKPARLPERGYPCLPKPFTPTMLLTRVRMLLDAQPRAPGR
jgi:two-component system cell cycle sensor histidine kinase/response regulator CckA